MTQPSWVRGVAVPPAHVRLAELKDQTTAGDHIVLSSVNRCRVIRWPARIEIADLAPETDKSPDLEIRTAAVIEGAMVHKP
jgi:hypothetical protein